MVKNLVEITPKILIEQSKLTNLSISDLYAIFSYLNKEEIQLPEKGDQKKFYNQILRKLGNLDIIKFLKAKGINSFYHITHLSNIKSILSNGLFSHNGVKKNQISPFDISNPEIQKGRKNKKISKKSISLHEFVPLFFVHQTPMISAIRDFNQEIVFLHIDPNCLLWHLFCFSDGNARSNGTSFGNDIEFLQTLDYELLNRNGWIVETGENSKENSRKKAAEVLIHNWIDPQAIIQLSVINNLVKSKLINEIKNSELPCPLVIKPNMFFH